MRFRTTFWVALAVASVVLCTDGVAQPAGDQVGQQRAVSRREEMRLRLESARMRVGPFRVLPSIELRDAGYESNVFGTAENPVSDWRATVRGEAELVLPVGAKNYALGTAAPEYTWYQKLSNRRSLGGTYGGSWLGLYNHFLFEAGGDTNRGTQPISSELELPARVKKQNAFVNAEFDIFRRLAIYGSASRREHRFEEIPGEGTARFEQLERNDELINAGIRYSFRSYLDFTASVDTGSTRFVNAPELDNDTHAILFGVRYDRPRLYANVSVGRRVNEATDPATKFPEFSSTTGSYYVEYQMGAPPRIDFYGHRSLVYSVAPGSAYFSELRNGIGITMPIGYRFGVRTLGEIGSNDYPTPDPISGINRKARPPREMIVDNLNIERSKS